LEFLLWSRILLKKCREAMRLDVAPTDGVGSVDGGTSSSSAATTTASSLGVTGSLTATVSSSGLASVVRQMSQQTPQPPVPTQTDVQNSIWLSEMERGYDCLVETIYPYIDDIKGAIALKK